MTPEIVLGLGAAGLTLLVLGFLGGATYVGLRLKREARGWTRQLLTPPRKNHFKGGRR